MNDSINGFNEFKSKVQSLCDRLNLIDDDFPKGNQVEMFDVKEGSYVLIAYCHSMLFIKFPVEWFDISDDVILKEELNKLKFS